MTVQELIDELNKIADKSKYVYVYAGEWTTEFEVIEDSDNTVVLDMDNHF